MATQLGFPIYLANCVGLLKYLWFAEDKSERKDCWVYITLVVLQSVNIVIHFLSLHVRFELGYETSGVANKYTSWSNLLEKQLYLEWSVINGNEATKQRAGQIPSKPVAARLFKKTWKSQTSLFKIRKCEKSWSRQLLKIGHDWTDNIISIFILAHVMSLQMVVSDIVWSQKLSKIRNWLALDGDHLEIPGLLAGLEKWKIILEEWNVSTYWGISTFTTAKISFDSILQ